MIRPFARPARLAAGLAVAAAVLSGCGSSVNAAVVDGRPIAESDLRAATEQIQEQQSASGQAQAVAPSAVLTQLILAPIFLDAMAEHGAAVSTEEAKALLTNVKDPTATTLKVAQVQVASQKFRTLSAPDQTEVNDQLIKTVQGLKITVNPRYGTFDAEKGLVPVTPNWIQATTPAAPEPGQP